MSRYWQDLASQTNGYYEEDDFETAAYRLVAEQVLYHADRHSRKAYGIIDQYERVFNKVLAPLGIQVGVDRQLLFAYVTPRHVSPTQASVAQTLFVLVLRGLYEEGMRAGYLSDEDGEIACDFIELQEKYRLMTGRDLPPKGELDALIRTARRWGIVRRLDDIDGVYSGSESEFSAGGIAIRPAIREVLGEAALQQLAAWGAAKNSAPIVTDDTINDPQADGGIDEAS
ncbi:hypothetical protein D9M69_376750 [compost metagenome]